MIVTCSVLGICLHNPVIQDICEEPLSRSILTWTFDLALPSEFKPGDLRPNVLICDRVPSLFREVYDWRDSLELFTKLEATPASILVAESKPSEVP